jgi:hypothetical protein
MFLLFRMAAILMYGCVLSPVQPPPADKPMEHVHKVLHGFGVNVDSRLTSGDEAGLGTLALERLDCQLSTVTLLVPADRLTRLRQVTIWLDLTNGDLHSPQYHPSADWLLQHGYDTAMAKCVHIPDAKYFVNAKFQREQPFAVLHELAHSYHDQVLGFENADIVAAYNKFKQSGKYNSVLNISGKMEPHYALTDQKEFFAEMTETYFGANDFYPFNSAELNRDEPDLFKLMANIWGPLP